MSGFAWGVQQIMDATLTVAGTGLPVYYRMLNTPPTDDDSEQLGFQTQTVTGGGVTDIQIIPQPRVRTTSMNEVGIAAGKLVLDSKIFIVSQTFVNQIMEAYGLNDEDLVWDGFSNFLGIVYAGVLYDVVKYQHNEVSGITVDWRLTCNAVVNKSE